MKGTRRHRYIAFHVDQDDKKYLASTSQLIQELRQQTSTLFSKNLKDLRLWVIRFDGRDGVLKCHYTEKEHIIQILISIKKIGESSVTITTSSTSGTIHGLSTKKEER
ncbi:MAG TPA: hypothetical protein HA258_03815 [Thermoplasmata archaeon]|nr:hypothetical protein [Thermoplasmata archaeon]HIH28964.1 hypothetical protein [Thermoplasmata archaeon]